MIDVEELICELHHIAGTESVDADIRRTACDAESALASLRAWVNKLQMDVAEREAVDMAIDLLNGVEDVSAGASRRADAAAATLRGLLERCAIGHRTAMSDITDRLRRWTHATDAGTSGHVKGCGQ